MTSGLPLRTDIPGDYWQVSKVPGAVIPSRVSILVISTTPFRICWRSIKRPDHVLTRFVRDHSLLE